MITIILRKKFWKAKNLERSLEKLNVSSNVRLACVDEDLPKILVVVVRSNNRNREFHD